MSGAQRLIAIVVGAFLLIIVARFAVQSVRDIHDGNDFAVYHRVAVQAAGGDARIYATDTPESQARPYLYSPAAAVLLLPLAWLPHDAAGIAFSIVKLACLGLLYWGAVRFCGAQPRDWLGVLIAMALVALALYRPVDSDVGNGQINIIVAALAVGGVWLMMRSARKAAAAGGAILLALAVAMKITPALLIAVPLLHRRWLAAGTAVAFTLAIVLALPAAWFGFDSFQGLLREHREVVGRFAFDWVPLNRQATLMELVQVTRAQQHLEGTSSQEIERLVAQTPRGGWGQPPDDPQWRDHARLWWLGIGLSTGALYLLGRKTLFAKGGVSWQADLAMLCALTVLLAPRAHKAHLVILIIPLGWVAARLVRWWGSCEPASPASSRGNRGVVAVLTGLFAIIAALMLVAEDVSLIIDAIGPAPYHPGLAIGIMLLVAAVAWAQGREIQRDASDGG